MTLKEISKDRNNNLNFIRFIAAIMVVFAHSFPLSMGEGCFDPLNHLTKGQISFGSLAVCVFFFFSGFFLNRSVSKGYGAIVFFKARCIRIFPCLVATVFICAFILGPCITQCDVTAYFTNIQTFKYLLNSILVVQYKLPGVFEQNIYSSVVNGSLWTLPIEFLCYIECYFLGRLGIFKINKAWCTIPIFGAGYVTMRFLFCNVLFIQSALRPCGMFYCGMLFDVYCNQIHIKRKKLFLCIVGLILTTYLGILEYGIILFLPYLLVYIAFGTKKKWSRFGTRHEISYSMYLCGFPIQQTVVKIWGGV